METQAPDRHRSDRGATFIEYALLVSLIAVVSLGSLSFMGDSAGTALAAVGSDVGSGRGSTPASGGGPSGGGGSIVTTTTAAPTTPTTAASTTPTTAAPATTTTTAPSTPTVPPGYDGEARSDFVESSGRDIRYSSDWESRAVLELEDQSGTPIPSGATVRIRVTTIDEGWNGDDIEREVIEVEVVDGRVILTDRHDGEGWDSIDQVRYTVLDVTFDDPDHPGWDGQATSVRIDAP